MKDLIDLLSRRREPTDAERAQAAAGRMLALLALAMILLAALLHSWAPIPAFAAGWIARAASGSEPDEPTSKV